MSVFADFLAQIADPQHRERTEAVLDWVAEQFPHLDRKIAWNQPMFTDHGTFIIGFSLAKPHLALAPEAAAIDHFSRQIVAAGYGHTSQLIRIPWKGEVDFSLLEKIIQFNIVDKARCDTFWRKQAKPADSARIAETALPQPR
ncbi:iron chaperone [Massilia pseudoviolaceinigra]|uniref:iron chaperone n=1 Tax=Massilia pseudoviolaceinigra TaxID=3057165 RepID=UPI0027968B91|nr:iron chaperone [Massilia sp. CCM 9206]MDQ1919297.1 iron chaperone [Massilia sp. CCM 9206]